jgi:glycosyltransferase involved in cell wall biosynthesis
MRIAIVHSFYSSRQPSGENDVVLSQVRALENAGHEVALCAWSTDTEEQQRAYPLRALWRVASGIGPDPISQLAGIEPDVVSVHNLFPNVGTRWLSAGKWPIVANMHNYRQVCSNGLLYRDGAVCEECLHASTRRALAHRCYRDSLAATAPLAWSTRKGIAGSRLLTAAASVVVPSSRALMNFQRFGVPSSKLNLIPYFIPDPGPVSHSESTSSAWIVAGRLSVEKGVRELLQIWPKGTHLDIAGSGPDLEDLRSLAPEGVSFLGHLRQAELTEILPRYQGLVFPGRSPEGIPSITIHALAAGLPIICRPVNGAGDLVRDFGVGALYEQDTAESLQEALLHAQEHGQALRDSARELYLNKFTERAWVEATVNMFRRTAAG